MRRGLAAVLAGGFAGTSLVLTACTGGGGTPAATQTLTQTVVQTRTPPAPAPSFTPAPARTVAPLAPGHATRKGERDGACPYIKTGLNETSGGGTNVADIEGDRIYRTTVLADLSPIGCRFYFYAPPYEAVAEIHPQRFPNATEAHNALVLTAQAGTEAIGEPDFVPGVDGISYRTKFFGQDGARDWAFAFAKGAVLVIVYTQRSDTSRNALYLGKAIVEKF